MLQLSFIWQTKDSTPLRREVQPTPKERPHPIWLPLFTSFVYRSPCKAGPARKGPWFFTRGSHSSGVRWVFPLFPLQGRMKKCRKDTTAYASVESHQSRLGVLCSTEVLSLVWV